MKDPRGPFTGVTVPLLIARSFGSAHPGGINVVLADGAVRNVSYTINPGTWLDLGAATTAMRSVIIRSSPIVRDSLRESPSGADQQASAVLRARCSATRGASGPLCGGSEFRIPHSEFRIPAARWYDAA